MVKVHKFGLILLDMKELGPKIYQMVKASLSSLMAVSMMDSGRMANKRDVVLLSTLTEGNGLVSGKMASKIKVTFMLRKLLTLSIMKRLILNSLSTLKLFLKILC